MSKKMISLLSVAAVASLTVFGAGAAQATDVNLDAVHAKQAANRAHIAAQVAKAQDLGLGPVFAAKLDRIKAKQAANRVELAALVNKAHDMGMGPVFVAKLDRIKAKQAANRVELAEKVNQIRHLDTVMSNEFEG